MHFLAVGDLSLGFDPGFVNASAAACLVGERPLLAVLPQAQKLAGFPKTAVSNSPSLARLAGENPSGAATIDSRCVITGS